MNAFMALGLILCIFSGAYLATELLFWLCARILATFDEPRHLGPFSNRFKN